MKAAANFASALPDGKGGFVAGYSELNGPGLTAVVEKEYSLSAGDFEK